MSSKVFVGYRVLGFVSNQIPLSVRYIKRRNENLVVTVVGKCFHTYGCDKLSLLSVSNPHEDEINSLASNPYLVFTSSKNTIYAWQRGTQLKHEYKGGHQATIHLLLPFGAHLISVDENSTLILWEVKSEEISLELSFSNEEFCISAIVHPSTYLNKILLGSKQGELQLWNLKTSKMIYEFKGWGSAVTVLEQAPAIDVAAIGLSTGDIFIHNLKFDETIMKFCQEWGPVTSISFRTDDKSMMASGSSVGHIALWNLDKKCLHSEIRDAHRGSVTGMKFLPNEPLMVTSSPDNTLKMWIFDLPDEGGRLLRLREGHSEPPIKLKFHGSNGENILSSGLDSTLRSFSTAADNLNKNLGQASFNRKVAKKKGLKYDPGKMPPMIDFASEMTREKQWDNIVACHRGLDLVTTWSYERCCMGSHKLVHERFKKENRVCASAVALSICGNFVFVGYNSGYLDKFNIQSGLFQGTYGEEKAHDGSVRGIVCDAYNQMVVSGGSDGFLHFWRFKTRERQSSIELDSAIAQMIIDRESGLIAVALDSFTIVIVDCTVKKIVRKFEEHYGRISDMTFGYESRWLIVASMDSTIKLWDIKTEKLLDCFAVSPACVSLTMSPSGIYLATAHVGDLGIYLWTNKTLYSYVALQPLPSNYEPKSVKLPVIMFEGKTVSVTDDDSENEEMEVLDDDEEAESSSEYHSPDQIGELVTLSGMPALHWNSLMHLDIIRARNKPKEPLQVPKNAPFFLPVVSGLKPTFALPEEKTKKKSDNLMLQVLQQSSSFAEFLIKCKQTGNCEAVIEKLKVMSLSMIDVELRCLSPENGGSIEAMISFLEALDHEFQKHRNFELLQSVLGAFLQMHGAVLASNEELRNVLRILQISQKQSWETIHSKFNQCVSILSYLRSSVA